MSIGPVSLLNITADVLLLLCALALAVIMLWQDSHRRTRVFAVCMVVFAAYGMSDLLWKFAGPLDYAAYPPLKLATIFYMAGLVLLTLFSLIFGQVSASRWRLTAVFSVPVGTIFALLAASGAFYRDVRQLERGTYSYLLTDVGEMGVVIQVAYLCVVTYLLWRRDTTLSRSLVPPMVVLTVGAALHGLLIPLGVYAVSVTASAIAIIMIGHTLVKREVYKPLADLNAELIAKNTELQEAARLKSQFLANMTHELRTPLNSIIGYTDMITAGMYGELNEVQLDRMTRVNRNGLHLLALINDVLDLSKIEAGRLELARSRVAVSPLIDAVCVEAKPRVSAKGLRLVYEVEGHLPPIWVDEVRVHQILDKLLSNAINFTDEGTITVRAQFDPVRNEVVISVADTGSGVEPSQRATLFEAFVPGASRQVDPRKGAGLGLAIAYRLAELHGGRMWYETVLGSGSTFYVAFPALTDKTATAEHGSVRLEEWRR